jgi:hypothetical protein
MRVQLARETFKGKLVSSIDQACHYPSYRTFTDMNQQTFNQWQRSPNQGMIPADELIPTLTPWFEQWHDLAEVGMWAELRESLNHFHQQYPHHLLMQIKASADELDSPSAGALPNRVITTD